LAWPSELIAPPSTHTHTHTHTHTYICIYIHTHTPHTHPNTPPNAVEDPDMRAFLTSEAAKKALFMEISLGLKRGCNGLFVRLAGGRAQSPEAWRDSRLRGGMEDDLLDVQVGV
jgi:hypothetical protein